MQLLGYYSNPAYTTIARAKGEGQVEDVAGTILWADATCHYAGDIAEDGTDRVHLWSGKRHNEGVNLAFVDGHAKWFSGEMACPSYSVPGLRWNPR